MESLCELYYDPIYTYALYSGNRPDDAMDLTHGFFEHVLQSDVFARADANKGRLRSFLLMSFKNFASVKRRNGLAAKRGGSAVITSLDTEDQYGVAGVDKVKGSELSPEEAYDKAFALVQLDRAVELLREEYSKSERVEIFDALRSKLKGDDNSYEEPARQLGIPKETARVHVHRMRKRLGEIFRSVVFDSISDPAIVDDEIRALRMALGS